MDPVVSAFHRINPTDHSLDGLPVTVIVVGFVVLVSTTLALRFTGRSGFGSAEGLLSTFALIVIDPLWRTMRAALVPAKREGRR